MRSGPGATGHAPLAPACALSTERPRALCRSRPGLPLLRPAGRLASCAFSFSPPRSPCQHQRYAHLLYSWRISKVARLLWRKNRLLPRLRCLGCPRGYPDRHYKTSPTPTIGRRSQSRAHAHAISSRLSRRKLCGVSPRHRVRRIAYPTGYAKTVLHRASSRTDWRGGTRHQGAFRRDRGWLSVRIDPTTGSFLRAAALVPRLFGTHPSPRIAPPPDSRPLPPNRPTLNPESGCLLPFNSAL